MSKIDFASVLACLALIIMGAICGALILHEVPANNQQLVTFALGAIAGALTVGGGQKVAGILTHPTETPPHE